MKKKLLIFTALFAAFLMLMIPAVNVVNAETVEVNNNDLLKQKISNIFENWNWPIISTLLFPLVLITMPFMVLGAIPFLLGFFIACLIYDAASNNPNYDPGDYLPGIELSFLLMGIGFLLSGPYLLMQGIGKALGSWWLPLIEGIWNLLFPEEGIKNYVIRGDEKL